MYSFFICVAAPQSFESEVDFDVIFLRDGSPIVDVSFEVCRLLLCERGG